MLLLFLAAPLARAQVLVQFTQTSNPVGLITSNTSLVATGSVATTISAPVSVSGYQFAYWTFNGVRQADYLGQGVNPAATVVTAPINAVAQYIPATADTDGDGIPDWYEYWMFGTLTNNATSDTDGDGFTLADEYLRDYNPNTPDTLVEGGISRRSSPVITLVTPGYVVFTEVSNPLGFVSATATVPTNTLQILPDVSTNGSLSGYDFGEWLFNGVRVADSLGQSVGGLSVLVTSTATATAMFYPATQDTVGDGVPDWFKIQFVGSLTNASVDLDGDGFTLADEYLRDYNPNVPNILVDGGISRRTTAVLGYSNPGLVPYQEISSPLDLWNVFAIIPTNTVRILPDVSTNGLATGYSFGQWLVNGIRVQDALGRSVGGLPVLVTTDTVATAQFYPTTQDTVGDGVPDWFKIQYYGSLTNGAASDTDGDGFTLADEYLRDYSPNVADTMVDGGISRRDSAVIIYASPYVLYTLNSNPSGVFSQGALVPIGTVLTTPDLRGGTNGYLFGHWELNGVRQQDTNNYPLTQITLTLLNNTTTLTAFLYPPTQDSNGNGIPDWWEDYYFGGPTNAVATADPDEDGMNNFQEYYAGTNPRDHNSRLAITQFALTTNGWIVGFQSVSGIVYRVEFANFLASTNTWQTLLDNIVGDGTFIQVLDPTTAGVQQRYYRVRVP